MQAWNVVEKVLDSVIVRRRDRFGIIRDHHAFSKYASSHDQKTEDVSCYATHQEPYRIVLPGVFATTPAELPIFLVKPLPGQVGSGFRRQCGTVRFRTTYHSSGGICPE